jgi:RNA polymerase sigma factor (sigma-70 family)
VSDGGGPSDSALALRVVLDDDRHAFATLVRRHQSAVRAFCLRLCKGDTHAADDTAQEVFLLAYKKLSSWRGEGSLRSWLLRLAFRAFLTDARRAHHRREQSDGDEAATAATAPVPDDAFVRRDVNRALDALRVEQRAALVLTAQEGLSHDEAARVLQMPLGTLKSHVSRGKERLRALLAAHDPLQPDLRPGTLSLDPAARGSEPQEHA